MNDGWITWGGGECPVDGDVVVEVKLLATTVFDVTVGPAHRYRWKRQGDGGDIVAYRVVAAEPALPVTMQPDEREYTGSSVSYYTVHVPAPTSGGAPYDAECNDIIESLGLSYAEGNVLKAVWRIAAARQGKSKRGYDEARYDAEKIVFFGQRMVAQHAS